MNLKQIRQDLNWSVENLSNVTSLDIETIIAYEKGQFSKDTWIYKLILNVLGELEEYDHSVEGENLYGECY